MANKFVIASLQELDQLAQDFAKKLKGNEVILLEGDLGVGKTTFTKYILKHLGVEEDVVSPTFTLMNIYHGKFEIYHIDSYRVDGFDISDIVGNGLIIIEWPKDDYSKYGYPTIKVNIQFKDGLREFSISGLD